MPGQICQSEMEQIIAVLRRRPEGLSARDISQSIEDYIPFYALQYRLRKLQREGRIVKEGKGRLTRYKLA